MTLPDASVQLYTLREEFSADLQGSLDRLAEIGGGGGSGPPDTAVAGGVVGQQRTVGVEDVAPGAVHIDLADHPDHRVGVSGRCIQQVGVRSGQRGGGRHDEHHRGRGVPGTKVGGFDERV